LGGNINYLKVANKKSAISFKYSDHPLLFKAKLQLRKGKIFLYVAFVTLPSV